MALRMGRDSPGSGPPSMQPLQDINSEETSINRKLRSQIQTLVSSQVRRQNHVHNPGTGDRDRVRFHTNAVNSLSDWGSEGRTVIRPLPQLLCTYM